MKNSYKNDLKKSQKCDNLDDFVDVYFTEPAGLLFAKLFIKLGIGPNGVTVCSMITGIIGGLLLMSGLLWVNILGIAIIILSAIFDCSDGQVARITNKRSFFGRWFDGIADGFVYGTIYLAVAYRMYSQNIPFTNIEWAHWGIIPIALIGIYFHQIEAKVADYFRNSHMYFYKPANGHELSRSKYIKLEVENAKGLSKMQKKNYYNFTKAEERFSPNHQKLFDMIEDNGNVVPDNVREYYKTESSKIARLTAYLMFSFRTYVLFVLLLLHLESYLIAFVLLVLEPLRFFLKIRYEKIAKHCIEIFDDEKALLKAEA